MFRVTEVVVSELTLRSIYKIGPNYSLEVKRGQKGSVVIILLYISHVTVPCNCGYSELSVNQLNTRKIVIEGYVLTASYYIL